MLLGRLPREEAQWTTQDTLEGLCLSAGLGTPWAPPGGAGGGVWGEGRLGVSAESAAPATLSRIKQKTTTGPLSFNKWENDLTKWARIAAKKGESFVRLGVKEELEKAADGKTRHSGKVQERDREVQANDAPAYNDLTCDWQVWFSSCSSSRLIRGSLKRKCSPEADARLLAHSSWIHPMLVLESCSWKIVASITQPLTSLSPACLPSNAICSTARLLLQTRKQRLWIFKPPNTNTRMSSYKINLSSQSHAGNPEDKQFLK
ncbi:hypothetical protein ILYODFUR_019637 [Ilyodon furcidens]|uniref:Uncharacterized protein n=1 Tax=Ilyodon furcidens TaxID=33524 RepID=A0ABV0UTF5_9TELE